MMICNASYQPPLVTEPLFLQIRSDIHFVLRDRSEVRTWAILVVKSAPLLRNTLLRKTPLVNVLISLFRP